MRRFIKFHMVAALVAVVALVISRLDVQRFLRVAEM